MTLHGVYNSRIYSTVHTLAYSIIYSSRIVLVFAGIDVDSLMECAREGFVQASQRKPSAKTPKVVNTCLSVCLYMCVAVTTCTLSARHSLDTVSLHAAHLSEV